MVLLEALHNNARLGSFSGLDHLRELRGRFWVHLQPGLTSCVGLRSLERVAGGLTLWGTGLRNLRGMYGLRSIGGDFNLAENARLESLTGMDVLTEVGGSLALHRQGSLATLAGLEGLTVVHKDLIISNHSGFASFRGLQNLFAVGGNLIIDLVVYKGETGRAGLSGLEGLRTVRGSVVLNVVPFLEDVGGLEALTVIGGRVLLRGCTHLLKAARRGATKLSRVGSRWNGAPVRLGKAYGKALKPETMPAALRTCFSADGRLCRAAVTVFVARLRQLAQVGLARLLR